MIYILCSLHLFNRKYTAFLHVFALTFILYTILTYFYCKAIENSAEIYVCSQQSV